MAFSDLLVEYLDLRDEVAEYRDKDYALSPAREMEIRAERNSKMDRLLSEMDRYTVNSNIG